MILSFENIKASWKPFFIENEELLQAINADIVKKCPDVEKLCPAPVDIFNAFELIEVGDIRALVIGQDPYFNGEACGLSFSIKSGYKVAPSLKNINKELISSLGVDISSANGDLSGWCNQVMLLNTSLTTESGVAGAHKRIWKAFSKKLIEFISSNNEFMVVLAWGKHAHEVSESMDEKHHVIKTSHPSPLGFTKSGKDFVSFKGSDCFGEANRKLAERGKPSINWNL